MKRCPPLSDPHVTDDTVLPNRELWQKPQAVEVGRQFFENLAQNELRGFNQPATVSKWRSHQLQVFMNLHNLDEQPNNVIESRKPKQVETRTGLFD
jgi:hypothetical protein